jgi:hypothetical protein
MRLRRYIDKEKCKKHDRKFDGEFAHPKIKGETVKHYRCKVCGKLGEQTGKSKIREYGKVH